MNASKDTPTTQLVETISKQNAMIEKLKSDYQELKDSSEQASGQKYSFSLIFK